MTFFKLLMLNQLFRLDATMYRNSNFLFVLAHVKKLPLRVGYFQMAQNSISVFMNLGIKLSLYHLSRNTQNGNFCMSILKWSILRKKIFYVRLHLHLFFRQKSI